jgi:cbb3-type cytochrome oxidase subunit 3
MPAYPEPLPVAVHGPGGPAIESPASRDVEGGIFAPHLSPRRSNQHPGGVAAGAGRDQQRGLNMPDLYFWIMFFGAPLFLFVVTAIVFRPSAREQYREAKQVIFADDEALQPQPVRAKPDSHSADRRASRSIY